MCVSVCARMLAAVCGQSVVAAVGGTAGQPDNRVWRDLTSTTTIFTRPKRGVRLVATHTHIHKNTHTQAVVRLTRKQAVQISFDILLYLAVLHSFFLL